MLWLLARVVGKAALSAAEIEPSVLLLSTWALVMTASLVLIDLHRRKELALLHNLGITTAHAVALATVPAFAIEAILVMLPG